MRYLLFCTITVLFLSLYFYSCANRTIPTGGPKDTIPPNLVEVIPANKSINFDKEKITLTFDEYIKTKDINTQLIITPRIDEDNIYKVNKQTLTIELNQKLDSNTTYTFNFQETVQDITESTPARDLVIAFSTGNYIDSLSIYGEVLELLTKKPIKDAVVALYDANDTLDIFNSKPQYFTKTKEDGSYRIENLKADTFKIYAFTDQNKNLTNQSEAESYGFVADPIYLDSANTHVSLEIIRRNVKEFNVQNARPNGRYYEVKFSKFIEDYSIRALDQSSDSIVSNPIPDQNTVRFYNTINSDSLEIELTAIDTIGQQLIDTVAIKFPQTQRASDPVNFTLIPKTNQAINENLEVEITFNKPTYIHSLDSAFIYYDSLSIDSIRFDELSWNKYHNILTINKKLSKAKLERIKEAKDSIATAIKSASVDTTSNPQISARTQNRPSNEEADKSSPRPNRQERDKATVKPKNKFAKNDAQVILFLSRNTFMSIENDTLPEITATYSFKNPKDTGLIKGKLLTDYSSFTVQLLDKSYKLVDELEDSKNFMFSLLPPGDYLLRILIDNNKNGVWDAGNILKNEEPEDVFLYPEPIILKANWEINLDDIEF